MTEPDGGVKPPDAQGPPSTLGSPPGRGGDTFRRVLPFVVFVVVAALMGTWVALLRNDPDPPVRGIQAVDDRPFGDAGILPPGPVEAVWSPNGAHLAVIDQGQVRLAVNGSLRDVTERGGRVVDVAWMPGSNALLVVEGPSSTGILPVVRPDGEVLGVVKPDPPIQPGAGHGATVAPDGRTAVLVAVERPALEDEGRYLVAVDLRTGATKRLTTGAGVRNPRFIAGTRVAVTVDDDDGPAVVAFDLVSGKAARLAAGELLGVVQGAIVVIDRDGRTVRAVAAGAGEDEVLATLDPEHRAVAIDPAGRRLAVVERAGTGEEAVVRMRSVPTSRRGPPAQPGG